MPAVDAVMSIYRDGPVRTIRMEAEINQKWYESGITTLYTTFLLATRVYIPHSFTAQKTVAALRRRASRDPSMPTAPLHVITHTCHFAGVLFALNPHSDSTGGVRCDRRHMRA